jgi:hypothetical protein
VAAAGGPDALPNAEVLSRGAGSSARRAGSTGRRPAVENTNYTESFTFAGIPAFGATGSDKNRVGWTVGAGAALPLQEAPSRLRLRRPSSRREFCWASRPIPSPFSFACTDHRWAVTVADLAVPSDSPFDTVVGCAFRFELSEPFRSPIDAHTHVARGRALEAR